jgi:hypothetical protein
MFAEITVEECSMTLYHGSDNWIEEIDLNRCEPFKDFGKGFYTTAIRHHAEERAKAVAEDHGTKPVVTAFSIDETAFTDENISIKRFPEPSVEWVEFVMHCRNRKLPQPPHTYDIVEGPIANDKMRAQFSLFERGAIDMATVLRRITYLEDTHQISFHTPAAIAFLKAEPDYPRLMVETITGLLAGYLVEDRGLLIGDALNMVYNSTTYEKLVNRATALYRESPAYIYELLKQELA